jgi:hypothetical protein
VVSQRRTSGQNGVEIDPSPLAPCDVNCQVEHVEHGKDLAQLGPPMAGLDRNQPGSANPGEIGELLLRHGQVAPTLTDDDADIRSRPCSHDQVFSRIGCRRSTT